MDQAAWLTNADKVVGVLIAGLGAYATSPDGARHFRDWIKGWLTTTSRRALRPLGRVLPFLRTNQSVEAKTVTASASISMGLALTATGRAWHPNAPVNERIEALRAHVLEIEGRLHKAVREITDEQTAREAADQELSTTLRTEIEKLYNLLEARDRDAARIDGRGLPLVFLGVTLTALPDYPALFLPFGWVVPIIALAIAGALGVHLLHAHRTAPVETPG